MAGQWPAEPGRLLAQAGAPAAAGPVRHAGGGSCMGHGRGPSPARQLAQGGGSGRHLLEQLVRDHPAQFLLREVRAALPARSPVVAGSRGAVLPRLALAGPAGPVLPADTAGGRGEGAWGAPRLAWRRDRPRDAAPVPPRAAAAVVATPDCRGGGVGYALGCRPLRWIGVRSYGIYQWHSPVIVLTSPANSGEDLARAGLQVAATIGLAALSWRFVEEPVRQGALSRL